MNLASVRMTLVIPAPEGAPKILERARERLARLITSPLRFAELHGSEMLRPAERRRMEPRRLERREAINLVGSALLKHTDVVSLRVGSPRGDGGVTPPGHDRLAEETGLSLSRLRRALADGRRAGYWTSTQPRLAYTAEDGTRSWSAFRVIYQLTARFFERLGLGPRLKKERDRASERKGERRRIYALALLAARDALRGARNVVRGPRAQTDPDAAANAARRMLEMRVRLRAAHADWPPERIDAEARRLLGLS